MWRFKYREHFNSNHTFESISISGHKISHLRKDFYFVGEFDASSFMDMPLTVLPQIMGIICLREQSLSSNKRALCTIFRFLRCIPELCNVSDIPTYYL
jgi:hypothetical protein